MRQMAAMLAGALCALATPALAASQPLPVPQAPERGKASQGLMLRGGELIWLLDGSKEPRDYFNDAFLAAVPEAQIKTLIAQWLAQYGKVGDAEMIERRSPYSGTMRVEYERATATVELTVEPTAPHKVSGLLVKGFEVKGDSPAKIDTDFAALPGKAGYLVEKLGPDGKRQQVAGRATTQQFAIASTFKLYVLAELASQVQAGRRSWSDVVPILESSYSSPATQNWPRNTPVTLQTLATWMVSVSDNAATDALIRVLGRDTVEEKLATIGHSAPDMALPMLTTVEAFALKSNPALRARFQKASEAGQRDLLVKEATALRFEHIDMAQLGSGPVAIDSIEWFAAPADLGALLDTIRRTGNQTALDVLAVNKGAAPASAAKWQYLGYKGGSEPGVISMSFLAQSKAGEWYAISGSWNNMAKEVDNAAFAALMAR
ncbi:MAG TPA: serine hydrolase, partial [Sphingorhabdus sp.]|nr:serine hydrolase [Sphingorhabdus sp.]